ncbi:MAG: phenylalanine--tRNA ligase subunit beta [Rhodospirillaceae bacterium]
MKFTLGWLKEHLDTDAPLDAILDRLSMVGLEVEGVTDRAKGLETFVVGHVLDAKQHPNADRLRVCQVDTGSGTVELVCGAPNARTGLKGVFAPSGAYIPGTDITLKPTEIRGVTSNGMLLSEREMGLSDEHDGIVELPEDAEIGSRVVDVMGLSDPVIEIAITPNRGDCLGVRGIARDLAASGLGALKALDASPVKGAFESPIKVSLDFTPETASACSKFVGRFVRGVKNGPSPKWLQDRLTAVGLRPISALVDVTNFVSFAFDRPLHVFDADKVTGNIAARLAKPGERMLALNETEYALDDEMTVIADEAGPEAIAGVVGGMASGCTDDTTNVFLEVAYFDPVRTAMTGRKLNLQTDARYRFERGVDPAFLDDACEIATRMIIDLCGGEASTVESAGPGPDWRRSLDFRLEKIKTLGGTDVYDAEAKRILEILGFGIEGENGRTLTVTVPSWRGDVVCEACLVEEVVRLFGYGHIHAVSVKRDGALTGPVLNADQRRRAQARRLLASRGLVEAVTYSFMPGKQAALFGGVAVGLKLSNPISADLDVMRPTILPNLLDAAARNGARGQTDFGLFEVGPQFTGPAPGDQEMVAAGIRVGRSGPRHWAGSARPVDAFDAKADAQAVLADLGLPADRAQITEEAPGWYHPGRSGALRLGPMVLAAFGEIHPGILKAMDVKGAAVGFEIYFSNLPKAKDKKSAAKPHLTLSSFQAVERDFAFVVDANVEAAKLINAAYAADKALVTQVRLFDLYEGPNLGAGKKSLAINVTLQPADKTLTDAEIDAVADKIVAGVKKATGGELRA